MGFRIIGGAESGGATGASRSPKNIVVCASVEPGKVDWRAKLKVSRKLKKLMSSAKPVKVEEGVHIQNIQSPLTGRSIRDTTIDN